MILRQKRVWKRVCADLQIGTDSSLTILETFI